MVTHGNVVCHMSRDIFETWNLQTWARYSVNRNKTHIAHFRFTRDMWLFFYVNILRLIYFLRE